MPSPAARVSQLLRFGKMTFTPAQGILDLLAFGHIHGCADDFNDLAGGIPYRMRDGVKALDPSALKNDSILSLRVRPVRLRKLHSLSLIEAGPVVGMNSIANQGPRGLQFRIELINAKNLFRPEVLVGSDVDCPTARVGEPLCLGKVGLPPLQLPGQQFLFGDIHCGAKKALEQLAFDHGNSDATNVAKLAVGANNSFLYVATGMFCDHSLYGVSHKIAIMRVKGGEILVQCWRSRLRIEPVNVKQFFRPVIKKSRGVERPTSHTGQALAFVKIKLAALKLLLSALAVGNVLDRPEHLVGTSGRISLYIALTMHSAEFAGGPQYAIFHVVARPPSERVVQCTKDKLPIFGMDFLP